MESENASVQPDRPELPPFELVRMIVEQLTPLSDSARRHVLNTAATWLQIAGNGAASTSISTAESRTTPKGSHEYPFGGRTSEVSPKDFILEKDPQTDTERVACLAYYLTHYRETPHFKTEDISKLNTEAAQRKFANAALTVKNAFRDGFLVASSAQGLRQLSALGEQFVQALPDRDRAQASRKRMASRRIKGIRDKRALADDAPTAP